MNVHYLQHVPFEGLGSIEPILTAKGHRLTSTQLYRGEQLPDLDTFDWLIVMGGPMGIHEAFEYPWLGAEKEFIKQTIQNGKLVLGICLGAQLIADALGAQVRHHHQREIGWFDISCDPQSATSILAAAFPQKVEVFHWHGDSFDIPPEAVPLASSAACNNQGFIYADRVLALQFHLETTAASAQALIDNSGDELDGSDYVQTAPMMLANPERFTCINRLMTAVLESFEYSYQQRSAGEKKV
ncbi:MAG: type 1 glutamine amidotransferase [Deltaproteobacteria bacterium]|jgi:GMP synthase-like glutamine amidotransferase|nr:type 1 glutamine amidotransferase [Deltaproteobacteria bacterium]MCW8892969.1 type 1 glutamine amidotransferase [Deltaproteobacteria bacterium]